VVRDNVVRGHTFSDFDVVWEEALRNRRNQLEFKLRAREFDQQASGSLVLGLGTSLLLVSTRPIPTHTGTASSRPSET